VLGVRKRRHRLGQVRVLVVRVMNVAFAMSATTPVYLRLRKDCGSAANRLSAKSCRRTRGQKILIWMSLEVGIDPGKVVQ